MRLRGGRFFCKIVNKQLKIVNKFSNIEKIYFLLNAIRLYYHSVKTASFHLYNHLVLTIFNRNTLQHKDLITPNHFISICRSNRISLETCRRTFILSGLLSRTCLQGVPLNSVHQAPFEAPVHPRTGHMPRAHWSCAPICGPCLC